MTMNERIREVRKAQKLSQAKFAREIPISNGYIAEIELGHRDVNDRVIKLICLTYGVNEQWLRTGRGSMFLPEYDEKLEQAVADFKKLKPEFQDYVFQQIHALLEVQKPHKETDASAAEKNDRRK